MNQNQTDVFFTASTIVTNNLNEVKENNRIETESLHPECYYL